MLQILEVVWAGIVVLICLAALWGFFLLILLAGKISAEIVESVCKAGLRFFFNL